MAVPIIIPMTNTRTRDCIVQEGVRYCESQPMSNHDLGMLFLLMLVLIAWFGFWTWCSTETEMGFWALAIAFCLPLAVGALILL